MSETTTRTPDVQPGDLVVPLHIEPVRLHEFYAGKVGVAQIGAGSHRSVQVKFAEEISGSDTWYLTEWRYADAEVGDKVRIIAALDGATEEFKAHAAGRTATLVRVRDIDGHPVVRFDNPFTLDGHRWAEVPVQTVVVIEPGTAPEPEPEVVVTPETEASLREKIAAFEERHDRLQDVLSEQAEERDWCSEFEDFCYRNDLESRRDTDHDWLITVDLHYDKSVDEMVDYIEGTSCSRDSERVRFTYRTTVSWRGRDVDDADISDLLSDEGFSEWSDYDVVDTEHND